MLSHSVVSDSLQPYVWTVACQVPLPIGFFQARILECIAIFLLQGIFPTQESTHVSCVSFSALTFSHVQIFVTPWTLAHQVPLSMGILQARTLEWIPMSFSRGSSQPRDQIQVSLIAGRLFTIWATRETHEYWSG